MKSILLKSFIIYAFLYNSLYFVNSVNDDKNKDQSKPNISGDLDESKEEAKPDTKVSKENESKLPQLPPNPLLVKDETKEEIKNDSYVSEYYKDTTITTGDNLFGQNILRNDTSKYDILCMGTECEYIFKDNAICLEVKYKDEIVWQYDYVTNGNDTPSSVKIDYMKKFCWVKIKGIKYTYKYRDNKWEYIFKEGGKTIILNIKVKQNTEDFNFHENKKHKINTYVGTNGVLFKGVRSGDDIIWYGANQNEYTDKVIIKKMDRGKRDLILTTLDGKKLEFIRHGNIPKVNNKWIEVKKEDKPNVPISESNESQPEYQIIQVGVDNKIKPVELNIGIKEDTEHFKYIDYGDIGIKIYIPKDGYLFKSVRQSQVWDTLVHFDIWSTENQNEYVDKVMIKNLELGGKDLILRHKNGSKTIFHRPLKFMPWSEKQEESAPISTLLPVSKYPSEIIIVTLDDNNEPKENDTAKYIVFKYDHMLQYIFTSSAKCIEVKSKQKTIWMHDSTKFKRDYLKEMYVNTKTKKIVFNRYRSYFIYTYSYDWISNTNDNKKKLKHSDFSIITINNKNEDIISANDTNMYHEEQLGNIVQVTFKPDAKCIELKHDNKIVWRHKDHPEREYPKKIHFHTHMKVLFIEINFYVSYFYRFSDGEWLLESTITNNYFSEYNIKVLTKDEEGIIDVNDTRKFEFTSFGPVTGILFKDKIKTLQILYDEETVFLYEFDELINEYPKGLYFVSDPQKRIIWNEDRSHYIYPQGPDYSSYKSTGVPSDYPIKQLGVDRTNVIGINLNINKSITRLIDVKKHKDTNTVIYIPKDGYLIQSIKDEFDIWSTEDVLEFLDRVILTDDDDGKKLILRNPDGNKIYFYKKSGLKTWLPGEYTKETSIVPISKHPKHIEVFFEDDDDPSVVLKNEISKYTLHKYGHLYHYVFHNAQFVEVVHRKRSLWTYNERKYGKQHPEEMYLNDLTSELVLNNYQSYFIYTYSYDWISNTNDNKKKLKHSDFSIITINNKNEDIISANDTNMYHEEQLGNIVQVTFKPDAKCIELKHDNKIVWRHKDHPEREYPKKIHFHTHMKVLFIEIKPELIYFYRFGDGEWKLEIIRKNNEFSPLNFKINIKDSSNKEYIDVSFGCITGYKFKNKRGYLEVFYGEYIIYEYSNDPKDGYIEEMYFFSDTEKILVMVSDMSYYIYTKYEESGSELVDARQLYNELKRARRLRREKK